MAVANPDPIAERPLTGGVSAVFAASDCVRFGRVPAGGRLRLPPPLPPPPTQLTTAWPFTAGPGLVRTDWRPHTSLHLSSLRCLLSPYSHGADNRMFTGHIILHLSCIHQRNRTNHVETRTRTHAQHHSERSHTHVGSCVSARPPTPGHDAAPQPNNNRLQSPPTRLRLRLLTRPEPAATVNHARHQNCLPAGRVRVKPSFKRREIQTAILLSSETGSRSPCSTAVLFRFPSCQNVKRSKPGSEANVGLRTTYGRLPLVMQTGDPGETRAGRADRWPVSAAGPGIQLLSFPLTAVLPASLRQSAVADGG